MSALEVAAIEQYGDPVLFVQNALERAKTWLSEALEHGDIDSIVELKSQAEAIRAYTTQKQLGKDAELSATEIVRRAERGIGMAIRKGQEEGTIRKRGQNGGRSEYVRTYNGEPRVVHPRQTPNNMASPTDYVSDSELGGKSADGIYAMTDSVSDEQFEQAIEEAKAEKNLSRANVVRKVKGEPSPLASAERSEWNYKRRRIDVNRIIEQTVSATEGLTLGLGIIRDARGHWLVPEAREQVAVEDIPQWITSLSKSIASLDRLKRDLANTAQGLATEGDELHD